MLLEMVGLIILHNMFELKKDIKMPGHYYRAGQQQTKEEWLQIFPDGFDFDWRDWFIDLKALEDSQYQPINLIQELVNEIFDRKGLHSISYRQTACICVEQYLKKYR